MQNNQIFTNKRPEFPLALAPTPLNLVRFRFDHEGQTYEFDESADGIQTRAQLHLNSTNKRVLDPQDHGESASKRRELKPQNESDSEQVDHIDRATPISTHSTNQDSFRYAYTPETNDSQSRDPPPSLPIFNEPALLSPTASPRSPRFESHTQLTQSDVISPRVSEFDLDFVPMSATALTPMFPDSPVTASSTTTSNSNSAVHSAVNGGSALPAIDSIRNPNPNTQAVKSAINTQISGLVQSFDNLSPSLRQYALFQLLRNSDRNTMSSLYTVIENALEFDILSELPPELQGMVLQNLDIQAVINASEVCKQWYKIIEADDNLWKTLLDEHDFTPTTEEYMRALNEKWGYYGWATPENHPMEVQLNAFNEPVNVYKALFRRLSLIHQNWTRPDIVPQRIEIQCPVTEVITCLNFDEDYIIACTEGKNLNVYDTKTGQLVHEFASHEGGVWALKRVGKDTLVSGSIDHTVRVWSMSKRRCTHVFRGHHATVRCLDVVMPVPGVSVYDFPIILTGSRDNTLRMWRLPSYDDPDYNSKTAFNDSDNPYFIAELRGHYESVRAVSGYGDVAISGSYDCKVRVWDLSTATCRHVLEGHEDKVYAAVIDPERNRCISASKDTNIKIWDLDSGSLLYNLEGHTGLVGLLGLRNNTLVSAAADKTLKIWNPENGALINNLTGHDTAILCFDHDGKRIVSGSEHHLKLWDTRSGRFCRDLLTNIEHIWQVNLNRRMCVAAVARGRCSYLEVLNFDFDPTDQIASSDRIREL